ncbi:kinesin-domain-containing protein [Pluteus cervinus]|uniref:Kinesin-domain-containing protein n=1 Tax=Pluteus cervinus TaxID=181527 RepID=A0ACD3ASQ0_9AGAR|nr:kinesin-domain-containing protein [Pluteus cervinus]
MASNYKVKIAARLRPRLEWEQDDGSVQINHPSEGTSASTSYLAVTNPRDTSQVFKFPFSSCYDQSSTQEQIFRNDVEPMLDNVYSGVTVTIFAYGVTSSGKTHTMQGTKTDPGVIPRVVEAMFDHPARKKFQTRLAVSYMEIYKDEVYDLLVNRETAPKLPVRENDVGKVFVANLTREPLESVADFEAMYSRSNKQRSVGATNLNRASSRSHAILTIEATVVDPAANKILSGKINLVDLAGSENNKLTGNDQSRMAESAAINKSLSVLGQVVHALNQGAPRIPYRNSKLTRILQDALGGSSIGLLICNIAPGIKFRQDTLNTLNFAVRTKNIENKPVVNERDTRPPPKSHFAAMPPPAPKPTFVAPPPPSQATSGALPRSRTSLLPSRQPRASAIGGASGFQPFALPKYKSRTGRQMPEEESNQSGNLAIGLSEKEIDERISKAVEAEVARRLEARERERQEEDRRLKEQEAETNRQQKQKSPRKEANLPPGVLTPLLKRHRDLDDELKSRLQELEKKFERGNKETQLADVLSPVSKKKTGRAYVALARAHSEKGDLQVALELYRKAETYVPDNVKLKERIIEIEWAVKNNKPFMPSPKRSKRSKKNKGSSLASSSNENGDGMDVDEACVKGSKAVDHFESQSGGVFGLELTNAAALPMSVKGKRPLADVAEEDEVEEELTLPKRQKKAKALIVDDENDDWMILAPQTGRSPVKNVA